MHHTKNTSWGIIDFDDTAGAVFVQQKWLYQWMLWNGVIAHWTYQEKLRFHSIADKQIWGFLSNKLRLVVTGASPIAQRFAGRQIGLNFDVKWVVTPPMHWTVIVWKMPPLANPTTHISYVDIATKTIHLDTADLEPYHPSNQAGQPSAGFNAVPHEFLHGILSGNQTANPDEYLNTSPHIADTPSIMNIGRELRQRHFAAVVAELNTLVPNLRFQIVSPIS